MMSVAVTSCSSSDEPDPENNKQVTSFTLPAVIDITPAGEYTFDAPEGSVPSTSDYLLLENASGISTLSSIIATTNNSFTVRFNKSVTDGIYRVYLKSGDRRISLGSITINIVTVVLEPAPGATIYGVVATSTGGVKDVVVSDGFEVTTTDQDGVYNLRSDKENGYVFITLPSGYEADNIGVMPVIYKNTNLDNKTAERHDFKLNAISGQDNYKVLFLGDMHLAKRNNDIAQFGDVTNDINSYCRSHASENIYLITLGDMTWDIYWYDNAFQFPQYKELVNTNLAGQTIFHTMGNHDNDYKALNNFNAEIQYRANMAPNYYSFNIGKVHYVVLDDIDCDTYDGTTSRDYKRKLNQKQLNWLAKDLQYVDNSTPLVITSHAPYFRPDKNSITSFYCSQDDSSITNQLFELIKGHKVHFVTGHTHVNYNVVAEDIPVQGYDFTEHNVAAVCASWWWSGKLTPGQHLCTDGTPGGYAIWDIKGTDMKWTYKCAGMDENVQFKAYDLNKVSFSNADVPNMTGAASKVLTQWNTYCAAYPGTQNNEVLINIFNWNPHWTLEVTTPNGSKLPATQVKAYDPQHIAAMTVKRFNAANLTSVPNFCTEEWFHFFKVTAPDATSTLTIKVSDEFGHTWTETMTRPKAFTK